MESLDQDLDQDQKQMTLNAGHCWLSGLLVYMVFEPQSIWAVTLCSVVPSSLSSPGKAGRRTVRAETCLSGKRDVRFHELDSIKDAS